MQKNRSIKVLLVEDIEMSRWLIVQSLRNWPQIVPDEAANGKEAVEKVQQNEYDIIFMDMRMPVMNGYEAAGIIRNLPEKKYKQIPIIALTGDSADHFHTKKEAIFFTDILSKPFDFNDLKRKILQYVSTPGHQPTPEVAKPTKPESLFKGNKQREEIFYREAIENLQAYKNAFKDAIVHRDAEKLSDLKHKATIVMHVLALHDLQATLEKCQHHLKEKAPHHVLEQDLTEGETCFDKALTTLQERLKQ
jgi:CheY-like chemotaxis protein